MNIRPFLWILPFLCFLCGYYLLKSLCVVTEVETPPLVGKTLHEAVTILSDLNLNPRIIAQKEEPDLPAGTIMNQNPIAMQMVKPHQSIFLVVSTMPGKPLMPNLIARPEADAIRKLQDAHIPYKIFSVASAYPQNSCCAQQPAPDEPVNSKAVVYLSAGNNKPVIMPYLKNKPVDEVRQFLQPYSVTIEILHAFPQPLGHRCEQCVVIDQRPLEGSLITLTPSKKTIVQLKVGSAQFSS